ncbi:hypothetical protein G7Y89_g9007 [Cudoniella acicularis]|uniref:Uncharacterized protein n=1 Tax=Cudoniella acicularis TaxID=354080 RepID=A0A8H4W0H6_9HELO|nr:hypothetical protein G7Y89_g9007 [Cudoniella acicularis]
MVGLSTAETQVAKLHTANTTLFCSSIGRVWDKVPECVDQRGAAVLPSSCPAPAPAPAPALAPALLKLAACSKVWAAQSQGQGNPGQRADQEDQIREGQGSQRVTDDLGDWQQQGNRGHRPKIQQGSGSGRRSSIFPSPAPTVSCFCGVHLYQRGTYFKMEKTPFAPSTSDTSAPPVPDSQLLPRDVFLRRTGGHWALQPELHSRIFRVLWMAGKSVAAAAAYLVHREHEMENCARLAKRVHLEETCYLESGCARLAVVKDHNTRETTHLTGAISTCISAIRIM